MAQVEVLPQSEMTVDSLAGRGLRPSRLAGRTLAGGAPGGLEMDGDGLPLFNVAQVMFRGQADQLRHRHAAGRRNGLEPFRRGRAKAHRDGRSQIHPQNYSTLPPPWKYYLTVYNFAIQRTHPK